jgi:hypothetical protein
MIIVIFLQILHPNKKVGPKSLKLNYRSAERFSRDYELLKSGRIFLPSKTLLPLQSTLTLNFTVPGIDRVFTIEGEVAKTIDEQAASILQRPTGMVIEVAGGPDAILSELNAALRTHQDYQELLGLTPPKQSAPPSPNQETAAEEDGEAKLSLDWLRKAVAQEAVVKEDVPPLELKVAPTAEKKDLTPEERKKVKPSGEFLMDLTKAMLRSGYYASDHPGSEDAKQGLYEKFQNCLGESRQVEIIKQETREKVDILISGILEEPVNVRTLVGTGMAELFLPKLTEYFKRKALVSFAVKNDITPEHFESFMDIMSDPKADSGQGSKVGQLLSTALAEHGITEISAVFMDDLIMLELNLPWRVEMAIQRLAKDLKMLPMFQGGSDENIRNLKLQIIKDIIRPLRHPEFLKDLVINCYIIAKHVDGIEKEDIEQVIIESFPLDTLLPTSHFIFAELNELRERYGQPIFAQAGRGCQANSEMGRPSAGNGGCPRGTEFP